MIHTVFPKDADEMPQDFPTWEEAKEYAEENFSECGANIQPKRNTNLIGSPFFIGSMQRKQKVEVVLCKDVS